jgi:phage/plasmid-like protein (TIGR03299 family)
MSHEITIRANKMAEIAYTGDSSEIWHGLGQQLEVGAPLSVWKEQAGMDWEAFESIVTYNAMGEIKVVPDKKVLFRSDTQEALSVIGAEYKIVQPGEILEFFNDLITLNGMKMSTAGTLFGGRRFWALADTGNAGEVVKNDEVRGYLLLTTSLDGSMSTQARFTSTRVVCNNTLTVALQSGSKSVAKVTHHKQFDPKAVKIDLGLMTQSWGDYMDKLRALSNKKMTAEDTRNFYQKMFFNPKLAIEDQSMANHRLVEQLMLRAQTGVGSEFSRGTAWGALNGATELYTHWTGKRDASHQFWDSYFGNHSNKKDEVYEQLLATV